MGLDLSLLPFDCDRGNFAFSHTVLDCERRYVLFEAILQIEKIQGVIVPAGFTSFRGRQASGESGYGETIETPYGDLLRYLQAVWLCEFVSHNGVKDNYKNRAVWTYLACLPSATKVALYWH